MGHGLEGHMNPAADVVFIEKRTPPRWKLERNIRLGDVLVILTILIVGFLSYRPMDSRMARLEEREAELEILTKITAEATTTLKRIVEDRLALGREYPAHRHVGRIIFFPAGTAPPPRTSEKQEPQP